MQLLTTVLLVASVAAAAPAPAQGPTALRVRGSVTTEDGTAIERARVRTEAIAGVGGGQFVGQREFQAATDKKGQWGLLGITRGVWIFEVTADHHLPHVVAIPVAMTQAPVMPAMPWRLALTLQRTEESGAWAVALADVAKKAGTDRDEGLRCGDRRLLARPRHEHQHRTQADGVGGRGRPPAVDQHQVGASPSIHRAIAVVYSGSTFSKNTPWN